MYFKKASRKKFVFVSFRKDWHEDSISFLEWNSLLCSKEVSVYHDFSYIGWSRIGWSTGV